MNEIIKEYEKRLMDAMKNDDIDELSQLLSDDLKFVNHFGQFISKNDDLESHKQKIFSITDMSLNSQDITMYDEIAIVISDVSLKGTINGSPLSDHIIYTRVWKKTNGEYKVVSGQATQVK